MYQEFYNLKEKPFSLTPDPKFIYQSKCHRAAIECLLYGIYHRVGFMVVTGDIGTGKTSICRALLERLEKNVRTAVIFNSFLTERELLESILQDFGYPSKGKSRKELIDALNTFLIQQLSQGENVVLIIDEAQNLSIPVLEQIRMLSNLETEKEKMLQIILLGQSEFDHMLQSPELRQLNQRIAIRLHLVPFTRTETESYIYQRLILAGAQGSITFSKSAINEIYKFSEGVPRLINLICDRALLGGFVDQTYHINKEIVKRAKRSLLGKEADAVLSRSLALLKRSIPLPISLFMIFLSLFVSSILSDQRAKNFIFGRIQGIYSHISIAPEHPASKIGTKEPLKDSSEVLQGGRF